MIEVSMGDRGGTRSLPADSTLNSSVRTSRFLSRNST